MPDLVAPIMPEFYSPGRVFLSAFQQAAARADERRRTELQAQHMASQEGLAWDEHAVEREKIAMEYKVKSEAYGANAEIEKAKLNLINARTKAIKEGIGSAAQRAHTFNQTMADITTEAMDRFSKEYHLDDGTLETTNPIAYAGHGLKWLGEYHPPRDSDLWQTQQDLKERLKQKSLTLKDPVTDKTREVPLYQVAQSYYNPVTHQQTFDTLVGSGFGKAAHEAVTDWGGMHTVTPAEPATLNPEISSVLDAGKETDFAPTMPRRIFPRKVTGGEVTQQNLPELPTDPNDTAISDARALRSEINNRFNNGSISAESRDAAFGQLNDRLNTMNIDPSELDATGN